MYVEKPKVAEVSAQPSIKSAAGASAAAMPKKAAAPQQRRLILTPQVCAAPFIMLSRYLFWDVIIFIFVLFYPFMVRVC